MNTPAFLPSTTAALRTSGWIIARKIATRTIDEAALSVTSEGAWCVAVGKVVIGSGSEKHVAWAAMAANEVAWAHRKARQAVAA